MKILDIILIALNLKNIVTAIQQFMLSLPSLLITALNLLYTLFNYVLGLINIAVWLLVILGWLYVLGLPLLFSRDLAELFDRVKENATLNLNPGDWQILGVGGGIHLWWVLLAVSIILINAEGIISIV